MLSRIVCEAIKSILVIGGWEDEIYQMREMLNLVHGK